MEDNKFKNLFRIEKPIIGMIHLAGETKKEKIKRALEELSIYEEEEINGAIIEDYHGDYEDVCETLKESSKKFKIIKGINILSDPYSSFKLICKFDAKFVQFDSVQNKDLNLNKYKLLRENYNEIIVLGGIRFKYIKQTGCSLKENIEEGMLNCDAIVTTGEGTGIETPIEKLRDFRDILQNFPLIVGAGVNLDNLCEQLDVTDGAIIGSYFKPNNNTYLKVDRKKVRDLMDLVKQLRDN